MWRHPAPSWASSATTQHPTTPPSGAAIVICRPPRRPTSPRPHYHRQVPRRGRSRIHRIGRVGLRDSTGDPIYFSPSRPSVARVCSTSPRNNLYNNVVTLRVSQGFTSTAPPRLRAQPANSDNNTAPSFLCACAELKIKKKETTPGIVCEIRVPATKSKYYNTSKRRDRALRARPDTRTGRRSCRRGSV